MTCLHRVLLYISHKRGSQDGVACAKCRRFWKRTRGTKHLWNGSALVLTPRKRAREET